MGKRVGIVLGMILIAGLAFFLLTSVQRPADQAFNAARPALVQQTPNKQPDETGPAGADTSNSLPAEMLDGALEKATEPATIREGIRSDQVPEDNGLHWFLLAAELVPADEDRFWELREDIFENGWKEDPRIAREFERLGPAFEAIRKGLEVGNVSFPQMDVDEQMPYLAKWRELGRMMTLQALMDFSQGRYDSAAGQFAAIFDFATESSRNGFVVTHLIGYAIQETGAQQLCKTLQLPAVSAEQCRAIMTRIQEIDSTAPRIAEAVRLETDVFSQWFKDNSASPERCRSFIEMIMPSEDREFVKLARAATPDQLSEWCRQLAESAEQAAPLFEAPFYEFDRAKFEQIAAANRLTQGLVKAYGRLSEAEARGKLFRSGSILVAALETYRHENGAYPKSLDALAPSVLGELPKDPFTGQPFRYALKSGSYSLYSAGKNMKDDGGEGDSFDFSQDDYVLASPN